MAILALLLATRWPFLPPILVNFDSVNFALALEWFNPDQHRPQPPGYPFFVDLSHLVNLFVDDVHLVFFFVGIFGAFLAVWFTWRLGTNMFGASAGYAAAALLVVHPSFWAEGLLNPVRVWLAAGSAAVACFAWDCWKRDEPGPRASWLAAWAALGVASGFRPGLVIYLAPLLLLAGWRRKTSLMEWIGAGACVSVGILAWMFQVAIAVGGVPKYLNLLRTYLADQSASSSLVYGAGVAAAVKMAYRALAWIFVGASGWIWFVRRRSFPEPVFVLLWSVPSLLFLLLVHSAEPGHILPLAPPLCLVGGWVVASLTPTQRVVAILIPAALFFVPPRGPLRLSSIRGVRIAEANVQRAVGAVRQSGAGIVHVTDDAMIGWRLVSYYLPDVVVQIAPGGFNQVWRIKNNFLIDKVPYRPDVKSGVHVLDSKALHPPR